MSTVSEISKLGFPKAERVGVGGGVTILETQDSVLGQVRVRGDEVSDAGLLFSDGVDGDVESILVLVEAVSVSVREGSSLHILA